MPLTEAQRQLIVTMALAGTPRNEIAREIGCSPGTVTRWANKGGVQFDRSATEAATHAKQIDQRAKRLELNVGYLRNLERLNKLLMEAESAREMSWISQAIGNVNRSLSELLKIDADQPDQDTVEVKSALTSFLASATALADQFVADDPNAAMGHAEDAPETPSAQETP